MRIITESRFFYPNMEMHLATMSIGWQVETDTCKNSKKKIITQNELPTQAIHNKSDLNHKYLNEERSLGRPGILHFQFECWIISPAPPES